ncbi:hypothetical protein NC652_034608 [Populus alba x Populus x berolinensis]|nr:hypothetical protein NC652_034608 [Populus alba x Populus x berolinensis]
MKNKNNVVMNNVILVVVKDKEFLNVAKISPKPRATLSDSVWTELRGTPSESECKFAESEYWGTCQSWVEN